MKQIRCIVCEQEIPEGKLHCENCGFESSIPRFLSESQYQEWIERTVNPYRNSWMEEEIRKKLEQEAKKQAEQREKEEEQREQEEKRKKKLIQERQRQIETDSSFCGAFGLDFFVWVNLDHTVSCSGSNKQIAQEVSAWTHILAVSAGNFHVLGLKDDGQVVAAGKNTLNQCAVKEWKQIVQIVACGDCSAGLDEAGNVYLVGDSEFDIQSAVRWKNIKKISMGNTHILGLGMDGHVYAAGNNQSEQYENVSNWTGIVDIAAGEYHSLGLQEDGTVLASGSNIDGECNVKDWMDIRRLYAASGVSLGIDGEEELWAAGQFEGGFHGETIQAMILGKRASDVLAVQFGDSGIVMLQSDKKEIPLN